MAWTKISRNDPFEGSDSPFISITESHFAFNAVFVRQNSLDPSYRVSIFVDEQNRRVGFEFHKKEKAGSFALSSKGEAHAGLQCSSRSVVSQRSWLASVAKQSGKKRRFTAKKEGSIWVIQLSPAFEVKKARESTDISSDQVGIYRYLRENGEIVYIGRGPIKTRLQSPERKEWDFDTIEYSIVPDPDDQVKWEDYWIERFKDDNDGKIPFYNRVSGSKKYRK